MANPLSERRSVLRRVAERPADHRRFSDPGAAIETTFPTIDPALDTTPSRLLSAAECLLAERGFEGMSMRALATRAGTSVSAANYHFGSKLGLVSAVFVARIEPINRARLERLEGVVDRAAPAAPTLEDVIESFLRPSFEAWHVGEALGRAATPHLLAALHADPAARFANLRSRLFDPLLDRYLDVLECVLPEHDRAELRVRMQLGIGVMLHVIAGHLEPDGAGPTDASTDSDERFLEHTIAFFSAGLRSPALAASAAEGPRR